MFGQRFIAAIAVGGRVLTVFAFVVIVLSSDPFDINISTTGSRDNTSISARNSVHPKICRTEPDRRGTQAPMGSFELYGGGKLSADFI